MRETAEQKKIQKLSYLGWLMALSIITSQANAYIQRGTVKMDSAAAELKKAKKMGLRFEGSEEYIKNSLSRLKSKNSKQFNAKLENRVENPDDFQSFLYEIRDGRVSIENMKSIAQYEIFNAVQANWKDLKNTVLNETAANSFKEFEPLLRHNLLTIEYIPNPRNKNVYAFRAGNWAIVNIEKRGEKIVRVSWTLDIASGYDDNRLQPGVENIQIRE